MAIIIIIIIIEVGILHLNNLYIYLVGRALYYYIVA